MEVDHGVFGWSEGTEEHTGDIVGNPEGGDDVGELIGVHARGFNQ